MAHTASASLDNRTPCELVQLDFEKAFDRIDHRLLLQKLIEAGIKGSLLQWLLSLVTGRTQQVLFHGSASTSRAVVSGVPQGSVVGPTLFSIYINGVTEVLCSIAILYAHNLTLIKPLNSPQSYLELQGDQMSATCGLKPPTSLNAKKSVTMTLTTGTKSPTAPPLVLGSVPLQRVQSTTPLGVSFDNHLSFTGHIRGIMAKARRSLGFVTYVTRGMPPSAFRHLYTGSVLPHLGFCSPVWSPFQKSLEQGPGSVQRRAAYALYRRSVPRAALSPYRDIPTTALLQGANWHSLAHRRDVTSIRLFCNLMGTPMKPSDAPRFNARTGKIQPFLARTLRHLESCLMCTARNWIPLPPELTVEITIDPEDIRALCRQASSVFP